MVKNPQILEKLRKRELRKDGIRNFSENVKRYEEMYELACKLNPDIPKGQNSRHLEHIIQLTGTFSRIFKEQKDASK